MTKDVGGFSSGFSSGFSKRRKAKSPYQKYQKRPFAYHHTLKRWREAIKEGRHRDAREAAEQHATYLRDVLGWHSIA